MDDEVITISDDIHTGLTLVAALAPTPLPISSWRSLGGYLNYATWAQRERFIELDKAIMTAQAQQREKTLERANELELCMPHDEPDILTIPPGRDHCESVSSILIMIHQRAARDQQDRPTD
jgi:hypothetical protein